MMVMKTSRHFLSEELLVRKVCFELSGIFSLLYRSGLPHLAGEFLLFENHPT